MQLQAELSKPPSQCLQTVVAPRRVGKNTLPRGHHPQQSTVKYHGLFRYISRLSGGDSAANVLASPVGSGGSQANGPEVSLAFRVFVVLPLATVRETIFEFGVAERLRLVIEEAARFLPSVQTVTRGPLDRRWGNWHGRCSGYAGLPTSQVGQCRWSRLPIGAPVYDRQQPKQIAVLAASPCGERCNGCLRSERRCPR